MTAPYTLGQVPDFPRARLGGPFTDIGTGLASFITGLRDVRKEREDRAFRQAQAAMEKQRVGISERAATTAEREVGVREAQERFQEDEARRKREETKTRADAIRALLPGRGFDTLGDEDVIARGGTYFAAPTYTYLPTGQAGDIRAFPTRGAIGTSVPTGQTRVPGAQQTQRSGAAREARGALEIMRGVEDRNVNAAEKASRLFAITSTLGERGGLLGLAGRGIESSRAFGLKDDPDAQSYYQSMQALRLALSGIRGQRPNEVILALERSLMRQPAEDPGAREVRYYLLDLLVQELERSSSIPPEQLSDSNERLLELLREMDAVSGPGGPQQPETPQPPTGAPNYGRFLPPRKP